MFNRQCQGRRVASRPKSNLTIFLPRYLELRSLQCWQRSRQSNAASRLTNQVVQLEASATVIWDAFVDTEDHSRFLVAVA